MVSCFSFIKIAVLTRRNKLFKLKYIYFKGWRKPYYCILKDYTILVQHVRDVQNYPGEKPSHTEATFTASVSDIVIKLQKLL